MEKIKDKKAIPIIGMISSGKSTFLNALLGIDLLETKDNIATKFICVIRHNQSLHEPIFYHINLEKEPNSDNYIYYKDDRENESIGSEQIKERISKINKEEYGKEPVYKNLFYMLEIKVKNIENNEFLKEYDFYDIPGLNECFVEKKEEVQLKKDENKNDAQNKINKKIHQDLKKQELKNIKEIFPILKTKIEFGIIIINTENYYYPSNINIIENIYEIIQKQIRNYLFILNKIDKASNQEEVIKNCKAFFTNKIEDTSKFRIEDNVFQALNSKQFKNEMLMKSSYENYYLFYIDQYLDFIKSKKFDISFLDYINYGIKEKLLKAQIDIKDFLENFDENEYSKIIDIYEKNKSDIKVINYGFDPDDDDSKNILKAFYKIYSDKKDMIKSDSKNIKEILSFFNNYKKEKIIKSMDKANENIIKDQNINILKKQEKILDKFQSALIELKKYVNEDENIISILEKNLIELRIRILNQKKIYIPFIGISNSGKSTIINDIIGSHILPEKGEECTTRGIIVQHSFDGTTKLYETVVESGPNNNFYIFKEKPLNPIVGIDNVYSYLESLNAEYTNNESKQFYILKTPIKFLEEYKFSDDLKRRISFIDLPGGNTFRNTFNENVGGLTIYEKLLNICSSFVFISHGSAIKIVDNNIFGSAYYSIYNYSKIRNNNEYLKSCLFTVNMFEKLKEKEKNVQNLQKEISYFLFQDEKYSNKINASFFDAKKYSEYLKYQKLFYNIEDLFLNLRLKYSEQFNWFFSIIKEENFPKFCLKYLKKQLENLSLKFNPHFQCNEKFKKKIEDIIKLEIASLQKTFKSNDNNNIEKIANLLEFIQINIKNINHYKDSNCEHFFSELKNQINNSEDLLEKQYYNYLEEIIKQFNSFFEIPPERRNTLAQKEFNQLREKYSPELENIFKSIKFEDFFQPTIDGIFNYLDINIENVKMLLKRNKDSVNKSYKSIVENIKKIDIIQLENKLKDEIKKLRNKFNKTIKNVSDLGNQINVKYEIDNTFVNNLKEIDFNKAILKYFGFDIDKSNQENNDDLESGIISNLGFFYSISKFFIYLFKGKYEELSDNLKELKIKINSLILDKKRNFLSAYERLKDEILRKFSLALYLQSTDLTKISKQNFTEAKNLFDEAIELLYFKVKIGKIILDYGFSFICFIFGIFFLFNPFYFLNFIPFLEIFAE